MGARSFGGLLPSDVLSFKTCARIRPSQTRIRQLHPQPAPPTPAPPEADSREKYTCCCRAVASGSRFGSIFVSARYALCHGFTRAVVAVEQADSPQIAAAQRRIIVKERFMVFVPQAAMQPRLEATFPYRRRESPNAQSVPCPSGRSQSTWALPVSAKGKRASGHDQGPR